MSYDPDELYNLLPAVHRIRDVEEGEPLRQLLALITQQAGILEEDLEQLYDTLDSRDLSAGSPLARRLFS